MTERSYRKSEYFSEEFMDLLDRYFSESPLISNSSKETYVTRLRVLCDALGKDFLEITKDDAEVYFSKLLASCADGSGKKSSVYAKKVFYQKIAQYIIGTGWNERYENPFTDIAVSRPSPDVQYYRIPTTEDVDRILSKAPDKMYYLVFVLAFRTALTLSELVNLKISSFAKNGDNLFVQLGGKKGLLPLSDDVSALVLDYISSMNYVDDEEHLFYNKYNNALTRCNVQKCFREILKKLNLDATYSMKDLRNRCMLDMLSSSEKSGLDSSIVANYVGIGERRLQVLEKAAVYIRKNPADLVNIRVNKYTE